EWLDLATAELNAAIAEDGWRKEWQQERELLQQRIQKSRVPEATMRMQALVDETPDSEPVVWNWLQRVFSLEADLRCEGHLDQPEPPPGALFHYADAGSRPCSHAEAVRWTWERAGQWWESKYYSAPKQAGGKTLLYVAGKSRGRRQASDEDSE